MTNEEKAAALAENIIKTVSTIAKFKAIENPNLNQIKKAVIDLKVLEMEREVVICTPLPKYPSGGINKPISETGPETIKFR